MQRLWAPWRLEYVTGAAGGESAACVFCAALDPANPSPYIVFRGERTFAILNKYPYSNGHLLVVPLRHVGTLAGLDAAELSELAVLAQAAEKVLTEAYSPQGLNVGINVGRAAGAGAPGHLHVHLVPRWDGDTSFMTGVADTRVVPEELDATARRLRPLFEKILGTPD